MQFGDKPIKNLYDFTDVLRRRKVGDVVEVKRLRDGQPITASVKLDLRKQADAVSARCARLQQGCGSFEGELIRSRNTWLRV